MIENAEIKRLVDKFLVKKYMLDMGKGSLSKILKSTPEDIVIAKKVAKQILKGKIDEKGNKKLPKILIYDLETSPLKAYVWRRWKQNIYLDQTISEWFLLTWSAKWLFGDEVMSDKLTGEEVLKENDSRIVATLWKLIDEADMVIAHNGDSFDVPKMNARFLLNGLPPASPYRTIDTKKVAAKQFGFSSNKLDALAGYFGLDCKLDTDFKLWARCMEGDDESLAYMEKYNKYDVELLEEVYLKLRPWINAHPNVGLYVESDVPVCTHCGNEHLEPTKPYTTQAGVYDVYRCSCGALNRVRNNSLSKAHKKRLLISTAR